MSDQPSKSQQKRIACQKGLPDPFAINNHVKWRGTPGTPEQPERRYKIDSDGDHKYFVEVGMEAEFQAWVDSQYESVGYEGHDYNNNRIEGVFTFTDPRNR
jgi:hypothetical protein